MTMLELVAWYSPVLQGEVAAKRTISTLLDIGATFLDFGDDLTWHPVSDPYELLMPRFERFEIQHDFFSEVLSGAFISSIGTLMLMVPADHLDPQIDEQHAQGLLKLAFELYPLLRPLFAWVDVAGDNAPKEREITNLRLRQMLWANFYGPEYVQKYGREFLLNAPGWRKEELSDGGIAYILSKHCFDKTQQVSNKKIVDYFHPKARVKVYQAMSSL
jgi:hypothetical protein